MKFTTASIFATAVSFGIGTTKVYASPLADTLPYPTGPLTYIGPVEVNGKNVTLEGTVQEIYSQVKDLTGSILKPVDIPKDDPKHKLQTRSKVSLNCHPQGGGANLRPIRDGIRYLNGLQGKCIGVPRTCTRVSCSWKAGIFLCNDNMRTVYVPCKQIAEYAQDIVNVCVTNPEVSSLRGQEFDSDNWNVVIKAAMDMKKKKRKVLLMGKSGSGKSSMRSIIFSNYVAKDVRRLGATIDVEHSHVKFIGNLTLNLWDCGGQDAFMETYLASQRENIFSDVAVLVYVFDIESREVERDLDTYSAIIGALQEFSPNAYVFCLIHKLDLIQAEHRRRICEERSALIRARSGSFSIDTFGSSIWDQSLYKAWAGIVHKLIPNLSVIERFLHAFAAKIDAEEVVLFERSTFLTITSVTSEVGKLNPIYDRHERLSNIMKAFKHCAARNTHTTPASASFLVMHTKTPQFNVFLGLFTDNTYILVVIPPGEAAYNCAVMNTMLAREGFAKGSSGGSADGFPLSYSDTPASVPNGQQNGHG
ncbi:small monomeric GTPase [Trichophyton rubrum]|uniref:Small monomeric GTPase n=1 Tax=Trichophyton rubrum TaxID=5551 RepID=A0A178F365_TRIRU|nr:small monomeric GTPase [Trichophyton rubrum]